MADAWCIGHKDRLQNYAITVEKFYSTIIEIK